MLKNVAFFLILKLKNEILLDKDELDHKKNILKLHLGCFQYSKHDVSHFR